MSWGSRESLKLHSLDPLASPPSVLAHRHHLLERPWALRQEEEQKDRSQLCHGAAGGGRYVPTSMPHLGPDGGTPKEVWEAVGYVGLELEI